MPHIKLEHTEFIETSLISSVFKQLRGILIENAGIKEENCKCKAAHIPIYVIGNNESGHFYHLEISFLEGKSEEIKQRIGQFSLETIKKYFPNRNDDIPKQLSVEIREMNPKYYFTTNSL